MAKKRYRFATFNLLNFTAPPFSFYQLHEHYNDTQWQTKTQFITGLIQHINPDVIVFQEVFTPDALQIICEDLGLVHFATVDSPSPDHVYPNVLFKPVVAIASKLPIKSFAPLEPCPELLEYLNNQHQFKFNRTPIKCKFDIPGFGLLACYAIHLKSQRVHSMAHMLGESHQDDPLLTLLHETVGTMQSQISRSLEASIIYYDALKTQREKQAATLVMGDFNDALENPALSFMTQAFPPLANSSFDSVGLFDSFFYADNSNGKKPPSHYYRGEGNVLDYILCSKEFNPNRAEQKVSSLNYYSYDAHLDPRRIDEDICYSDHAAIAIEITL
ncbi:endonuclease/exonuclease/phosphatase family protein [Pseudoalteromonas peptidolytica]|uniref:endonuclease/exonuclease/phosphatase family protein n=1 Tax=Pseudoalteromonas peptidolytica TaxID=61150 RepID=UPI00298DF75C|nr:endonuclease/exonuclease/phosphatase family protein [Pseudoalteromonas peptidolytica]MDW7548390.1 endonuclease/exonuclease/phosphatase family protein [Pseudoalteromonas peptidolytica]